MGHYTTKPLLRQTEKLNIKVESGRLDDRPVTYADLEGLESQVKSYYRYLPVGKVDR